MRTMFLMTILLAASSCSAAGFRAPRLEAGTAFLEKDGGVGPSPELAVGYLFQDDLSPGGLASGWVGNAALRLTSIEADLGGADLTGDREELDLGARFYPYSGDVRYQPFVGAGGLLSRLRLEDGDVGSSTTVTPGVYAEAGAEFVVGRLRLGISYRHTFGVDDKLEGDDSESNLDGGAVLLSVGVGL